MPMAPKAMVSMPPTISQVLPNRADAPASELNNKVHSRKMT